MTSAAAVLYIGDKQKSLLSSSKGVINIRFQVVILGDAESCYGVGAER